MHIPEVSKSEVVYRGFFDLRVDTISVPNRGDHTYTVMMLGVDAVAVLAETPDGKFIVVKEYRHPTGQWLLGCSGGRIDSGEAPLEAAKRELLEETGYLSDNLISIGTFYASPAITEQKIHLVLAKNAILTQFPRHEPLELIQPQLMTKQEIKEQIAAGTPVDGILCTALLFHSLLP